MNARVAFDTHGFVKRLEAAGWSAAHAEALADAMGDIVLHSIATRTDLREVDIGLRSELKELSTSLRTEMNELSARLRTEMNELSTSLRTEMNELSASLRTEMNELSASLRTEMNELRSGLKDMELRLTLRMGAMLVFVVAILTALKILT
jgi:uncharacterized protein involved in exopolysaccharide biosynthesis